MASLHRAALTLVGVALLCASDVPVADAHPLSPSLLEIREQADGTAAVLWRTPTMRPLGVVLRPVLPPHCTPVAPGTTEDEPDAINTRWAVECGPRGLVGSEVGVEGLDTRISDVLLRVELRDGRAFQSVLRAREPSVVVPERERRRDVARRFMALGVDHIAGGYDHLLFVLGLLLLVRSIRSLIATITAFTLGHSVTLGLATFDLAHVPAGPVEALIAFSIFGLAVELARSPGPAPTAMQRRPWLMAATFGLLHGLGFAGALRETGLPAEAVPLSLLSFNVGIEVGQLGFVLLVLAARRLGAPIIDRLPAWSQAIPVYGLGSLAAFWTFERLAAL